jgi:hypothetical protein
MKIASATVQMESSHNKQQRHEVSETLTYWIGNRPTAGDDQRGPLATAVPTVQLSEAGKTLQSSEASAIQQSIDDVENDPTLRLIRAMVAMMTGHEIKLNTLHLETPAAAQPIESPQSEQAVQQGAGFGIEYTHHEAYSESEQTRFAASGMVRTTDGRSIDFSVAVSMARSYHEESDVRIAIGDTRRTQDPLVINFAGTATQLTSQRFKFDLNSDGTNEDINFVAGGSGFLAFDRNGDGQINNGSELFGAKSGNGFSELAELDSDHNGWIDESDDAYTRLRVWTKDSRGQDRLSTLKEADVGAISLTHTATPFDLKDANNELLGQIRASGIFLHERGNVGTIQQIDLTI